MDDRTYGNQYVWKMASASEKVLLTAKRTECVDAENIVTLIRKATSSLFGRVDVVELM